MIGSLSSFSRICRSFEEIKYIALKPPKSTKEMIELGEYMLTVKNKKMISLEVNINQSSLPQKTDAMILHAFSFNSLRRTLRTPRSTCST